MSTLPEETEYTITRSHLFWKLPPVSYTLYEVTGGALGRTLCYQSKKKADACIRALKKGREPPTPDGITPLCFATPIRRWPRR